MSSEVFVQLIALASSLLSGVLAIIIGVINNRAKANKNQFDVMKSDYQIDMVRLNATVARDTRFFELLEKQITTTQSQGDNIQTLSEATRAQTQIQSDNQAQIISAFERLGKVITMNEARFEQLDSHVSKMDELSLNVIERVMPLTKRVETLANILSNELSALKQKCNDDVKGELGAVEQRIRGDIKDLLNEVNLIKKSQEDAGHETSETNDTSVAIPDSAPDAVADGVVDRAVDSSDGTGNESAS